MAPRIGYLLPTREQMMLGQPETGPLLRLAERAERLGYDSVWIGDSLFARARHEPITMLAAIAARVPRIELGTAVLLPALRNPVVLAHQLATLDQIAEGRLILGVGIANDVPNVRTEFTAAGVPFEKRLGRMMELLRLCKALWSGETVNWDGRWKVENAVMGPTPFRPGGPPLWVGGTVPASLERAGRHFDGWMPIAPGPADYGAQFKVVRDAARAAGRDPDAIVGSMYLTVSVEDDPQLAENKLNSFVERYYNRPARVMRPRQAGYAGPPQGLLAWLQGYADAGASHLIVRFVGDHERHLELLADLRKSLR